MEWASKVLSYLQIAEYLWTLFFRYIFLYLDDNSFVSSVGINADLAGCRQA